MSFAVRLSGSIRRIFAVSCLSAALIPRMMFSLCRVSNDGIAYRDAISSARRRLVRCPEAATRFAKVEGAISMRRLDRAASDDAFTIGCVVVGIDSIISERFRRQTGVAGFVGFRVVGSSLIEVTGFAATLLASTSQFLCLFAVTGGFAQSGCGYSAGGSGTHIPNNSISPLRNFSAQFPPNYSSVFRRLFAFRTNSFRRAGVRMFRLGLSRWGFRRLHTLASLGP